MDDPNDDIELLSALLLLHEYSSLKREVKLREKKQPRRRAYTLKRFWVRSWLRVERRIGLGNFDNLMEELRFEDKQSFFNYLRVPPNLFDELLAALSPRLTKKDTNFRAALTPGLKLAVTIRHLASGDKYPSLAYNFRVSRHTITSFLPEVCQAIIDHYKDEVIQCPHTEQEWRFLSWDFQDRWNFPHAVGALDGKHVAIRKPPSSGSLYHNYKGFFSIILFALVDANYRFLWVDVGGMGHMSDAQIFNASELKECIEDGSINFPTPDVLPYDDVNTPYFLLGDDAFALRKYLMKPYSRRGLTEEELAYNYRISRARRVVENAFGILANRWQFLLTTLQQGPDVVRTMVEASICLHNIMRTRYTRLHDSVIDREDEDHNIIPGQWRQTANMHNLAGVVGPNRDSVEAKKQREYLKLYFNSGVGQVSWQPYAKKTQINTE